MVSPGQEENTACCLHTRPLISFNQTIATRWPSPRPIPNLLPICHKENSRLISTRHNWDPWLNLTPLITKYRPRRGAKESALSPRRRPSSSPPSRIQRSLPNLSYSRSTPPNRCGRFQRFASPHRKRIRCHRTRFSISPCPGLSGRRVFVRRRNRVDRPYWNETFFDAERPISLAVPDHGHFVPLFFFCPWAL